MGKLSFDLGLKHEVGLLQYGKNAGSDERSTEEMRVRMKEARGICPDQVH